MLFSDLTSVTAGSISLAKDEEIRTFSTDTRTLTGRPSEVFIAIQGSKRDGHSYVETGLQKGIVNFIVEKQMDLPGANVLTVPNSLAAFQAVATHHRRQFDYPVVGITGSNGKTTVKEWLSSILSTRFYVIKSPKSFNSQIGVPLSVLSMQPQHEIGVFEAGVSKQEEMQKLASIIEPTIGIFTTLGEAHDDGFFSREKKLVEKLSLFHGSQQVICRSDTSWYPEVKETLGPEKLITWALGTTDATYKVDWKTSNIYINEVEFFTHFNEVSALENATHCIVSALHLGLTQDEIQKGLNLLRPIPMRLELKKGINNCYILDDTYNNDLQGLKVAINYLDTYQQNEKKTLILSDILHTKKKDREIYGEIAELVISKDFHRVIGIGEHLKSVQSLFPASSEFFDSTEELIQHLPDFHSEMILIKGARDYRLEKVVQQLEERTHGTVLEVNFESLLHNLNQYRQLLQPQTKMMVMVKANAYGSGLLEVANFLQHQRIDQLGVAYVDEAIQLRRNGITLPIMIMNPYIESFSQFERFDLQPEIYSIEHLRRFLYDAGTAQPIHLKIDTGMHRLGFDPDELSPLLEELSAHPTLKVASIFTHFSSSDQPLHDEFTRQQAAQFDRCYDQIADTVGYRPVKHACNSPAIVRWPDFHYDMVRLGIGLHGFDPTGTLDLHSVSQLKSTISQVQSLKAGETVGYGRKGKIARPSKIATIPLGYEDGFSRVFGNGKAHVLINGHLCPTIGSICMDMSMVDVTEASAKEGDEVVVFGETPTIQELAAIADTIPYEILTNISGRVKRVFVSE